MSFLNELSETLQNGSENGNNVAENQTADATVSENTLDTNQEITNADIQNALDSEVTNNNDAGNTAENQPAPSQEKPTEQKVVSNFANEELAEANAYMLKNPGKTFEDYKALKVPTDQLKSEDVIRKYLSEKEGKSESQIAYELKRLELKEEGGDFDDDFSDGEDSLEYLKKKADFDELDQKARAWHDDYIKEQLNFDGSQGQNDNNGNQSAAKSIDEFLQDAKRAQEEYTQNYRTEIYKAVGDIKQIELNINGKEVSFVMDETFRTEMRKGAEDVSGIGKEFFDENGVITNPSSFIKENTLWANPKTRQPVLDFMIEQAILQDRANRDKGQRNITLDATQPHSVGSNNNDGKVVDEMLARRKTSF